MKYRKWNIAPPAPEAEAVLREAGYSRLLSSVLSARGIASGAEAAQVLSLEQTPGLSPFLMRDMDKAVARIRRAIDAGETVAVFGDYDADGVTSTVLLRDYLLRQGVPCLRYIPSRLKDGYGLSREPIQTLHEQGVTLLITVDCGITGNEEVAYANSLGMDVVITDHHECKETLPEAVAVVDPHRPDCPYPFKHLAGCGVALKLVMALGGEDRAAGLFERYCTLAALGTIADVMRMEGENRTIVARGLDALPRTEFVGVHALLKETGLWGKPVNSIQAGFILSPRINAAGRMGRADLAAELLEASDPARAEELARAVCEQNKERQMVEQAICADAENRIAQLPPEERGALVLSSESWHQGVIGIVASRLSEKYARPSFLIFLKDGMGKGSCRSYGGANLFEALEESSDLLEGFGGHALAAGFTIRQENIPAFRQRMNAWVRRAFGGAAPVSCLEADAEIGSTDQLTLEEAESLRLLEPYGRGNLRPVFVLSNAAAESLQPAGQGRHLKFRLTKDRARFDAIFFSVTAEQCGILPGMQVDAAFYLQPNVYRGFKTLQLQLLDIRPAMAPSPREAEDLDLVRRLLAGDALAPLEAARLDTSRPQFTACWKALCRLLPRERTDSLPLLRAIAAGTGGEEPFLRTVFALRVFQERGLVSLEVGEGDLLLSLNGRREKVDLEQCPYVAAVRAALGQSED